MKKILMAVMMAAAAFGGIALAALVGTASADTGDAAYMQWLADRGLVLPNGAMSSVAGLGRIICSDLARNGSEPVESRAVANAAHIPSFRADLYVAGAHATLCPGTPVN